MITPRFSCSQTENTISVRMYVPAVRAADIEMHVDGTLFSLHVNPYFLRLVFSDEVIEDDTSSASYEAGTGYLTVTLTKKTPGKDFKDLDVLAKLLAPPKHVDQGPIIEVVHDQNEALSEDAKLTETRELLEAAQNDWQLPQQIPSTPALVLIEQRYGFLDAYKGYFMHVSHTENEVNELGSEAERLTAEERRELRLKHEDEKWDEDYYMADFADDEHIRDVIAYMPPLEAAFSSELCEPAVFSETENADMLQLPRKEYLMTNSQKHNLYLTLLTVLFSYVYDARTTQNEATPESAWTICSLTPAFSALDPAPYENTTPQLDAFGEAEVRITLTQSIRRSLAFPLYRSFALSSRCIEDVCTILRHGRRAVLRALLETRRILDHHEVYYVYSRIWMDDFCRWIAADAKEEALRALGDVVASTSVDKQSIGWDLPALESVVSQQAEREPDSDDESEAAIVPENSDDTSTGSDGDSSSTSCSTSSSSSAVSSARGQSITHSTSEPRS